MAVQERRHTVHVFNRVRSESLRVTRFRSYPKLLAIATVDL